MFENSSLAAALSAADEASLTALANKGLYKRACKDVDGLGVSYNEINGQAAIDLGGEHCIIRTPLEQSICTCPSRTVCRHILGAILLLKKALPPELAAASKPADTTPLSSPEPLPAPEPEPEADTLTPKELEAVHEAAGGALSSLGGLLARGLVRADATAADELELAAVRAHAAKMADAERRLRNLSTRLADCTARKASFNAKDFMRKLTGCTELLLSLQGQEVTAGELGSFRSSYKPYPGNLVLLPIGTQDISGGEYTGTVYYFLNTDLSASPKILTYSDLRPAFYGYTRTRPPQTSVWGLSAPLRNMMRSKMTLKDAGVCEEKLSGSNVTSVIRTSEAELDCPQLRIAVITDYRELAYAAAAEKEHIFLIHIHRLTGYEFDKYEQTFKMHISDLEDRVITAQVKYRAESAQYIQVLEKLCKKIKDKPDICTVLANAGIEQGRVILSPIEFYDFLSPMGWHRFAPPERLDSKNAPHAAALLKLLSELEDEIVKVVRSGLASVQEKPKPLLDRAAGCGLQTLASLAGEFFDSAESYRHDISVGGEQALIKLSRLMQYISLAEKKLGVISAIYKMNEGHSI